MIALALFNLDVPAESEQTQEACSEEREADGLISWKLHIERGCDQNETQNSRTRKEQLAHARIVDDAPRRRDGLGHVVGLMHVASCAGFCRGLPCFAGRVRVVTIEAARERHAPFSA